MSENKIIKDSMASNSNQNNKQQEFGTGHSAESISARQTMKKIKIPTEIYDIMKKNLKKYRQYKDDRKYAKKTKPIDTKKYMNNRRKDVPDIRDIYANLEKEKNIKKNSKLKIICISKRKDNLNVVSNTDKKDEANNSVLENEPKDTNPNKVVLEDEPKDTSLEVIKEDEKEYEDETKNDSNEMQDISQKQKKKQSKHHRSKQTYAFDKIIIKAIEEYEQENNDMPEVFNEDEVVSDTDKKDKTNKVVLENEPKDTSLEVINENKNEYKDEKKMIQMKRKTRKRNNKHIQYMQDEYNGSVTKINSNASSNTYYSSYNCTGRQQKRSYCNLDMWKFNKAKGKVKISSNVSEQPEKRTDAMQFDDYYITRYRSDKGKKNYRIFIGADNKKPQKSK